MQSMQMEDDKKGIGLVAANGGDITDYEGVDKSMKKMLPMVAINTTAGTASEMTRFCIVRGIFMTHWKLKLLNMYYIMYTVLWY